jgi:hypothetical protein
MRRRGLTSATSLYVLRTLGHRHHTYSIGLTPYPMCVRRTSTLRMRLLGLLGDLGAVDYSIPCFNTAVLCKSRSITRVADDEK